MFDVSTFMHTQTDESASTNYVPVPVGEYNAIISKVDAKMAGESPLLEVTWRIDAPGDDLANEKPVRQSVWLDVNASGTGLDYSEGKNVNLGRLREAVGQNSKGQMWAPAMLEGQPATILVDHQIREGDTFSKVKSVRSL